MTKRALLLLLGSFVSSAYAQIPVKVAVWTGQPTYIVGDTVTIVVSVVNQGPAPVVFQFPTSCQGNFIIDDFDFNQHIACLQVLTEIVLPPDEVQSWDFVYPMEDSDFPSLSAGLHSIIGEVIGYGRSDTLHINVLSKDEALPSEANASGFSFDLSDPNPGDSTTTVRYSTPATAKVELLLFDEGGVLTRVLVSEHLLSGSHQQSLDLRGLSEGPYYCRIQVGRFIAMRKLNLVK